jgi:hypothetical protein
MSVRNQNRLKRLERLEYLAGQEEEEVPGPENGTSPAEAEMVPGEVAAAFRALVEGYRRGGLGEQEALALASTPGAEDGDQALNCPPAEVTWDMLERLAQSDPERALQRWAEIKRAARQELRSGARAGRAVEEPSPRCWERARFLAVRAELTEAWRPRNAIEQSLVDQMAQAQLLLWHNLEALKRWSALVAVGGSGPTREPNAPPRASYVEMADRAFDRADRMQRWYLRTLKALQGLRRLPPSVVVQHARQVNVGGQQVNVAGGAP